MNVHPLVDSIRIRGFLLVLLLAVSGCDPLSLASMFDDPESGGSILALLDVKGRDLELGSEVQGALSIADRTGLDGSYLEAWSLDGEPGQTFSIDLMSDDFDGYLYVVGPGLSETLRDDDGGGACHARVAFTVLEGGTFRVVASSSGSGSTGTYRLRVTDAPLPQAPMSCGGLDGSALSAMSTAGRALRKGIPMDGRMTGAEPSIQNGRPVQAWSFDATEGERVTIRLQSSEYDAYLYLFGPGMAEVLSNDDGGAGFDSELDYTFPESGTYVVGASALSSGAVGGYVLSVDEPMDPATLDTDGRTLRLGDTVNGTLTEADPTLEGQLLQAWAFRARAGQSVTVELNSDAFDPFLRVVGPGINPPLTDDDSAGDLNSRLTVTFPDDGVYRVVASSLGGSTGTYSLNLR